MIIIICLIITLYINIYAAVQARLQNLFEPDRDSPVVAAAAVQSKKKDHYAWQYMILNLR